MCFISYSSLTSSVFSVILFGFRGVVYSQSKKLWKHTPKYKIKYLSFFFCIPFLSFGIDNNPSFKNYKYDHWKRNVHSFYYLFDVIFLFLFVFAIFIWRNKETFFYVLFIRVCTAWKIRLCILLRKGVAVYIYISIIIKT